MNSGRGLFLFGAAGNGKTSIAERVTRAFGQEIWIPRAIGIDGEIMRVFDPANHEELPLDACEGLYETRKIDRRWVRIRRPTLIVGGELTMSALEVTMNTSTGICESPLQLKSNCGTLVIDDFGRQRMRIEELLNRWIVPAGTALRLPQHAQRQEDRGAVRPTDHLRHEPGAARPGRRGLLAADSLQDRSARPEPRGVQGPVPLAWRRRWAFPIGRRRSSISSSSTTRRRTGPSAIAIPATCSCRSAITAATRTARLEITNEYIDMAVENYFAVM